MVSSFFIVEDNTDFKEWFIRCADGDMRDDFRYAYSEDTATREAVKIVMREHNKYCSHCALFEQGATLEIHSVLDDIDDIECNDKVLQVVLIVLGLQKSNTRYVFGDISAEDLKARLLIAFALIDNDSEAISTVISNDQLLDYLDALYVMSEYAEKMEREICWIEYPQD